MKQTKLWLITIATLLCSLTANAHDFEVDGIYYNITSYYTDLTVAVTYEGEYWDSYSNEYSGVVTIPSIVTYNGKTYSVTSIESSAFSYCSSLTSVTIPEGVTNIEGLAFVGCSGLTSINIPESVTWIGDGIFEGCSSLISVTILGSVTSIEDSAFYGCSSLNSITILGSVTSIGRWAFYGCSGLTSVTLPEGVTSIEGLAFEGCSNLSSINIPGSVTSIETRAFDGCSSLTFITVADGNTVYDSREGCNAIIETNSNTLIQGCSTTVIPESVTSIGSFAFYGCSGLASIAVPESVTSIGSYAFEGCSGLTSITIPEGVTSIEWHTFNDCSSLTSVTIPEGVTSIGRSAFSGCNSLTSITIPGSVTSIESGVFYGCSGLTSVTIPKGVTSIEDGVFSGCNSLSSITIPEGVTSIGNYAFEGCSGLTSVTIPKGVTSIEDGVFSGCNSLTSVTIPEGVTSIGSSAFSGCSGLASIAVPESVTSIGSSAFSGCSGLASIAVPESVTSIGSYAFDGTAWYSNLPDGAVYAGKILYTYKGAMPKNTSVEVKEGTVSIGGAAFRNCSGLTSIILPEGVTSIGSSAFYGCSGLTSIILPEGVTSIGSSAFYGCSGLTSIILPEGVTSIGYYAFEGCSSLTSVTIPESMTSIGEYAFRDCTGELIVNCNISPTSYPSPFYRSFYNSRFSKVTIGSKVTSIGNFAFEECTSLKEVVFEDGSETLSLGYNKYNESNSFWPGEGLFYDCPLESVYLGRDLSYSSDKSYGYSPFYHRARIPEISLGNSITTIPPYLFYENESLPAITIPEGVTSIGRYAFYGCTGLTSITCMAEIPPTIDGSGTFYNVSKSIPLYVPVNFVPDYQNAELWKEFSNIKPITCLLTYMLDGEVYRTQSIAYGSAVTIIPAPTKEGHTFSGWSEAPKTMPANDVVISGSFAVNKYLVTFKIGEEVIAADSLEFGATIIAPEAPEKEGHTFNGWGEVVETVPANDVTIEGSYSVNSYLLTYTVDGDTIQSDSIAYGAAFTLPEEPTKEGYTFSGWSEAPEIMPADDVVISGVFTINKYLVTFMIDGVVMVADSLEYGTTIVAPEVAKKDGYTFDGWKNLPETVPAKDVVVEGKYTANEYLLTFVIDGALYEMRKVRCDEEIAALEIAEREGYTLVWENWIDKMPARDYTVRGKYVPNIYKVYYYVGEELVYTAEVAYGEAIPEYIYKPTVEGDVFQGWSGETYETMPAHDVVYTENITNGIARSTLNSQHSTIYDLMGRKVTDTENLKGGVYIVNGKKVVF